MRAVTEESTHTHIRQQLAEIIMIKETFFGSQGVCVFLKYDRLNCVPENVRFPLDSTCVF